MRAITWNMQGASGMGESKYASNVMTLLNRCGAGFDLVLALQEAGDPPKGYGNPPANVLAHFHWGGVEFYEVKWDIKIYRQGVSYYIYYVITDVSGTPDAPGRVNLALVAPVRLDILKDVLICGPGLPRQSSRPAIGIRYGNMLIWSLHAFPKGGGDAVPLLSNISASAPLRNYPWIALGDYNVNRRNRQSRQLEDRVGWDPGWTVIASGEVTYPSSSAELDYAVARNVTKQRAHVIPLVGGSDHLPVLFEFC
ncbi:endonuclease/exonuclease/phosphatase family protein [Streptomyces nanhaiensis]|uniref:endonuclease/exonuclease/phosphatase family protein n=1 Tax=Streptomyces nanhaiensis TaxID=679319 RepID=UPI00399CC476